MIGSIVTLALAGAPIALPRTEELELRSGTALTYRLQVALPRGYASEPKRRYPVVFCLDADFSFAIVRNVAEHLSDRHRLPEVIVVGVGYPRGLEGADWLRRYRLQRTRDYTPTSSLDGYPDGVQDVSGGGATFLRFIEKELVPFLSARYRLAEDRTLIGHSYGGLFALYAAIERPALFQQVISVSPSLWYDHRWLVTKELESMDAGSEWPVRIALIAGSKEGEQTQGAIAIQAKELAQRLSDARVPGLRISSRTLEGEDHDSVFAAAIPGALLEVFAKPVP